MTAFTDCYLTPECMLKSYQAPWNGDHISCEMARHMTRIARMEDLKGKPEVVAELLDTAFLAVALGSVIEVPALASLFVTFLGHVQMTQHQASGVVSLVHAELWAQLPITEGALVLTCALQATLGWNVRDTIVRDAWDIVGDPYKWGAHPKNIQRLIDLQGGLCGALSCQKTLIYSVAQKGNKNKHSEL